MNCMLLLLRLTQSISCLPADKRVMYVALHLGQYIGGSWSAGFAFWSYHAIKDILGEEKRVGRWEPVRITCHFGLEPST
jgi:hypothetical protein